MFSCRTVGFLYRILPLKIWRGFLILRHIENCAACQADLASRDEVRTVLIKAGDFASPARLWPRVSRALAPASPGRLCRKPVSRRLTWRWAMGFAGLMIVLVSALWLAKSRRVEGIRVPGDGSPGFQILSISIGGVPAQSYVFKPLDSDLIVVWAEKNP